MGERANKAEKIRVSVTLTPTYMNALDRLVAEGIYFNRGSAILAALRIFLGAHGIPPFHQMLDLIISQLRLRANERD